MLNRREVIASGLAMSLGMTVLAREPLEPQKPRAIAEGGALAAPKVGLIEVAIAVSAGTTWIDFVGPMAVFETWHLDPVDKKHKPRFKIALVGETLDPVDGLVPKQTFANTPRPNIIVVPAQRGSTALLDWLRTASPTTDVTMSVCVGAKHLARAGLLDGKTATSHHDAIEQFKTEFPDVKWVSGMRFVEGEKISTGGGLTAGIDLALRVVERYFGRDAAQQVADHIEYQSTGWMV